MTVAVFALLWLLAGVAVGLWAAQAPEGSESSGEIFEGRR